MIERALLDYVNRVYKAEWVIAGGYVRDRLLNRTPRDIDLFTKTMMSGRLKAALEDANIPYVQEWRGYNQDPPIRIRFMEYDVHLCDSQFASGPNIVERFDFNICRFWLDDHYQAAYDEADLVDLRAGNMLLQHVRTPVSSMRRGFLFEYRLDMKFLPADIRQLNEELGRTGKYEY